MLLGLKQSEVGTIIGVTEACVWNWENGYRDVQTRFVPEVHVFLGYAPWVPPDSFGGWLRQARTGWGLSRRELAQKLGVDEGSVARWEVDRPTGRAFR